MEYLKSITVVVFLCIIVELQTGYAIQCHVCNSREDPDCEDLNHSKHLRNCTDEKQGSKFTGCWKIDQWVDFKVLGQEAPHRVIRQCAKDQEISTRCYYRGGFGGRVNHCFCSTDGCNSATSTTVGVAASIVVVLAALKQIMGAL